ncbi:MAG: phosphoribosylamine--glycine ligase [Bacteroidetes bacterium]|nr:MAG: phosphoribosylamine--glycine ligase [Bacteroidota bacterium]
MRILVIGAGGREHALAWKIAQSPKLKKLFIAPGNAGTASLGTNVALAVDDFQGIKDLVLREDINLVVVGPEAPLVEGIKDFFASDAALAEIALIGPSQQGATLEGSKDFAKQFMQKNGIPTAAFGTFDQNSKEEALRFLERSSPPYVLKADGLAAGKGVVIPDTLESARDELSQMLDGKFGKASEKVVIEEFLEGIELSVFVLTDGKDYVVLPEAKDYKRIGEGDSGLNTGGMGAVSPVPFADAGFMSKVEDRIIKPTIAGLQKAGIDYRGFIFIGLMNRGGEPYVIEYNVRMGDPESEVVLPRIRTDFVELLRATAEQRLSKIALDIDPRTVSTVMMVSGGYPGAYEKGKAISGYEAPGDYVVFHAGTSSKDGKVLTSGGRVMAISAFGKDMKEALERSYAGAGQISFEGAYFRRDIGFDL